jgi:hypothetical protein
LGARTSVSGLRNDLDAGIFLVRNAMPAGAAGLGRHLPDPGVVIRGLINVRSGCTQAIRFWSPVATDRKYTHINTRPTGTGRRLQVIGVALSRGRVAR